MKLKSWYDAPRYFDIAFQDETQREVAFFLDVCDRYLDQSPELPMRIYEPGCGSGRLVAAMAALGHHVIALDANEAMMRYVRRRVARSIVVEKSGGQVHCIHGDMTDHVCPKPVDLAFCTFNTFRHLTSHQAATKHLRSVAASLRVGGVYVLGFHCLPMDVDPESIERWTAQRRHTRVSVTFRVLAFHRRARKEDIRVSLKATDSKTGQVDRIRSEFPLRLYTPQQAIQLLSDVDDQFELLTIHDFDYEIDQTRRVDSNLIDAVFVLRRREG
ncbi:MAG: class I SAM-dependent methyltransferase [Planctomycetota bacterium]